MTQRLLSIAVTLIIVVGCAFIVMSFARGCRVYQENIDAR